MHKGTAVAKGLAARIATREDTSAKDLDLNLLRLFEAIYRLGSVSRGADAVGLSQPAASQALARLRQAVGDVLFVRSGSGVRPTLRAEQLVAVIQPSLSAIEGVLKGAERFDPAQSRMTLRLHLNDIGEARLLPELIAALHRQAPGIRVETSPLPHEDIADALATGKIHFAFGYLPSVMDTEKVELIRDRYSVVVRAGHPLLKAHDGPPTLQDLRSLDYVAVSSHAETLRILHQLGIESQLALRCAHFLSLPTLIAKTDLAVIMPVAIARRLMNTRQHAVLPVVLPNSKFGVAMHWDRRFTNDPSHTWLRATIIALFRHSASA